MDMRRWMLIVGVAGLLLASTGCVADEVVYVDERGNELAVDAEGKPILPGVSPVMSEQAPVLALDDVTNGLDDVTNKPAPAMAPTATKAPAAKAPRPAAVALQPKPSTDLPSIDPSWDLPASSKPARTPSSTPSWSPKAPAAKKVNSSAGLDLPPAGS